MRKPIISLRKTLLSALCGVAVIAFAASSTPALRIALSNGVTQLMAITSIDSLFFNASQDSLFVAHKGGTYSIGLDGLTEITYSTLSKVVTIEYSGDKAAVENPFVLDGVNISVDGADVTINSSATDEIEYKVSGASDDGSLKIYSDKKYQITLNGLQLTNADGPAINSQSSKKGTIKVQGGTVNTLCDGKKYSKAPSGEDQKGTIFSEGQLIFKGAGTLSVTGLNKHAICSDDFVEIDNSTLKVLGASSDAIHSNDSVLIYGGNISLTASGDGIDCSGPITIAQASTDSLTISLAGDDTDGIKSDGIISIASGNVTVSTTGTASKAIKSGADITVSGGKIVIDQKGDMLLENGSTSYASAMKATGNIVVSGGDITIQNAAQGGKGLSADGDIRIADGTLNVACTGTGGTYDPSKTSDSSSSVSYSYKVYVCIPSSGNGGGMGGGGNSGAWTNVHLYKSDGTRVATLSQKATITGSNGTSKSFYYYDFGSADSGSYYFASDDYVSQGGGGWGGWGGKTAYSIRTSAFSGPSDGSDHYYNVSSSYSTSGTVRTYSMSDVTSTYANGTVTDSSNGLDNYFAACLKADKNVNVEGGQITLSHSGAMSKGIRCDSTLLLSGGNVTIVTTGEAQLVGSDPSYCTAIKAGSYKGTGGVLTVTASGFASRAISIDGDMVVTAGDYTLTCSGDGATYTNSSRQTDSYASCGIKTDGNLTLEGGNFTISMSGKGGKGIHADGNATFGTASNGGPKVDVSTSGTVIASSGWGQSDDFIGTAKAIKIEKDVVVNDGSILAKTTSNGGEGLESKASITFNGGVTECDTYDDGINAATKITFNGGIVYSHATGNDGIDCNGSAGFEFNGGIILASGTSSPEEGFDCDNNSFKINGGILIGTGGSTSSPTSATQPFAKKTSVTVTSGRYLSVKKSDGTVLFSYRCPVSVSGATVLLSSPDFTSGTSYTLVYGATAVNNPTETSLDGVFTRGGTLTGGSTTTFTPSKK